MRFSATLLSLFFFHTAFSQVDTIVWEQKTALPDFQQRVACGYFLIDSDFYVAGGQSGSNIASISTVWKYHIPTDSWTKLRNLPFGPAACGGFFVLNGKGYFLTARDSANANNCDSMFWQYDPANDSWTQKANFPDVPRQNSSSFSYGGRGYVGFTNGCTGSDNHLWQYDPISDQWSQLDSLRGMIASGRAVATAGGAAAYFIDGLTVNLAEGSSIIGDFWRYNITANTWDSLGQMPAPQRAYPVLWGFDNALIGGGGTDGGNIIYKDYYRYDVSQGIWTRVIFKNSFDSTGAGATFVFGNKSYYFGGFQMLTPFVGFSDNMWSFDAAPYFSTGISAIQKDISLSIYPNPIHKGQSLSVSSSESGIITFYDALGQQAGEYKLAKGITSIKTSTDNEVLFYKAMLSTGDAQNGKVIFIQ